MRGLQEYGGESNSVMQSVCNNCSMASSTKAPWVKLEALFLAKNGGQGATNGKLYPFSIMLVTNCDALSVPFQN